MLAKYLKTIRILLAVVVFTAMALLFLDVTGIAATYWGFLAKWQFVPAILSLNIIVIIGLVAATLLFGRIYCSVLCPLGIMQDGIACIRRL